MTKTILVSGSSKGIGLETLRRLRARGHCVLGNARTRVPEGFTANQDFFMFDSSNQKEIKNGLCLIQEHGYALTTLVACVGDGTFRSTDIEESWEHHLRANLLSQVFLIESVLQLFSESIAEIVVMSSIVGLRAFPDAPVEYSASKAALEQYIKVRSLSLAPLNISINSVAPGNVLFTGSSWDQRLKSDSSKVWEYINSTVPMKKFGSVSDIANMVDFLVHNSSFITGQTFVVDGGQTI